MMCPKKTSPLARAISRFTDAAVVALMPVICLAESSTGAQQSPKDQAKCVERQCLGLNFEEIVVTGTRTAQLQMTSPVRVELITSEILERQHALELSEAIRTVPGLSVRPIRGKEGQEAWLQGISANRVLVLIDGEEVSASTGSAVDLTQIATGDVDRIEIVKGATSVLYGSAAMGGVINVITKEPEEGLHYLVAADGGSFGDQSVSDDDLNIDQQRLNTSVHYKTQHWLGSAALNARLSDGWAVDPLAWDQQGADGHKINGRAALRYSVRDDHYYHVSYERYDQEQHSRFTELRANNRIEQNLHDDAWREHVSAKGYWATEISEFTLTAYDETYVNESRPQENLYRHAQFNSNKTALLWNFSDLPSQTLTFGAELFEESLEQLKRENGEPAEHELQGGKAVRDSVELFLQDDIRVGDLSLLPGLRWQKDSDFGEHLTPKFNFRWEIFEESKRNSERTLFLRGGVGRGYRVSNLKERYYVFDHSHLGYIVIGNPELEPEKSTSYQLGLVFSDHDNYQFDVNIFHNNLEGLIETVYSHNDGVIEIYQYGSVDKALTQGLEFNAAFQFHEQFRLQGGYLYLRAENKITERRLVDRPRHQVKATFDYNTHFGLGLSFIASWQDQEVDEARGLASPSWQQYNLKLNQQITKNFSVYGGVNNLTNTQQDFYAQYDNRPEQGRLVYLGLKFRN